MYVPFQTLTNVVRLKPNTEQMLRSPTTALATLISSVMVLFVKVNFVFLFFKADVR